MSSVERGEWQRQRQTDYCMDYYGLYGYEWIWNIEIDPTNSYYLPPFQCGEICCCHLWLI